MLGIHLLYTLSMCLHYIYICIYIYIYILMHTYHVIVLLPEPAERIEQLAGTQKRLIPANHGLYMLYVEGSLGKPERLVIGNPELKTIGKP